LRTLEPHIVGVGALLVKSTAITDFTVITETLLKSFEKSNGTALMGAEVISIEEDRKSVRIKTASTIVESSYLILCGGLMADRLAKMMAIDLDFRIIPFRGEYYQLSPQFNNIVSHLIYPIPDPDLPFLGVHLTMMVDGTVTVGPNAVLGWKREGYGKLNFSLRDVSEMAAFPGFWKVLKANLSTGFEEFLDSLYKPGYLKRVRKYCPQLKLSDLTPYPAGIRAQAVMSDGELVHDFLFSETERSLHVCNAPSPAATSALPIGAYLCDKAAVKFRL
ncbi:MAG: L-2-hydroxyglutarate oxidase, partial [Desulfobulbaceae bacterium]